MPHRPGFPIGALLLAATPVPAAAADIVLRNAIVVTMDDAMPRAEALAIEDGLIVAVGSDDAMAPHLTAATQVYDLPGLMMLPGFVDAHNHLAWSGTELEDISLYDYTSLDEMQSAIAEGAAAVPADAWVRGGGWDLSAFPGGALTSALLDKAVGEHPAFLLAADGHSAWVNSKALEIAGITAATPDPEGGRIERDASGAPTGILREAATRLVSAHMPDYTDAQVDRGLEKALAEAASYGITTIIDPKADDWMLRGYQRFADDGRLTLRVKAAVEIEPGEDPAAAVAGVAERRARYPGPLVEVNAVKVFVDGVIESETAAMLAPYVGKDFAGDSNFAPEALDALAVAADAAGLQVHAHAIGDRAVREALDAFAAARDANGPRDARHQIAHAEVIDPADIPRFGELGAIANFQPLWAYPDPYIVELTEPVIGPERSEWLYPIGAVLEGGGRVVAGSDWSVSSMNPAEGIEVGVTRQDPADAQGAVLTRQHRVPVEAMLRAYTADAAFAAFSEDEAGSLTVGKRGDVVVLDRDLTAVDPHDISDARVLLTLFGGVPVFRADGLPAPAGP